jgi:integrase/recombinase XerD
MRKDGKPRFLKPVGNPADPDGLYAYMVRYLEALKIKAYTAASLYAAERYIRDFIGWCDPRSLERPHDITKPILEGYQRYLFYTLSKRGRPLSFSTQRSMLVPVRMYFRWLARNNHILYNPASDLELPRVRRRLPRNVLTAAEVEAVMGQVDPSTPMGLRDRALLETVYSTGLRRMELVNLRVADVDLERGTVLVDQGKGRKDRMVPIGERALLWIGRYLASGRLHLVCAPDNGILFLTRDGENFNGEWLSNIVARYVDQANIGKRGSCHLFRHTMATLMLEGGADVRYIQAMLGHADLSTTTIYTQVAIRQLKAIHSATHPADAGRRIEHPARAAIVQEAQSVAALLSVLDDEAGDEQRDAPRH